MAQSAEPQLDSSVVLPETRQIAQPARETPSELKTEAGYRRRLPDDLLRQASKRVESIALIGAALWVLGPALGHLALYIARPEDRPGTAAELSRSLGAIKMEPWTQEQARLWWEQHR